jgi:ribosomal protein L7/L12
MFILLLVIGGLVGAMLGLIVLSSMSQASVVETTTAEPSRPRKDRRPHETAHSKSEERYPRVPPPLAPMSETPHIPQGWGDRVLTPAPPLYVTPEVPHATEVPSKRKAAMVADAAAAIAGDEQLLALLEQGEFLAAIKHYRDSHGVGLGEAKAALDAWRMKSQRREQFVDAVSNIASTSATDPHIVAAIRKGNVIEAIKLYRAKTGVSLQDAKEAIDTWRRNMGR